MKNLRKGSVVTYTSRKDGKINEVELIERVEDWIWNDTTLDNIPTRWLGVNLETGELEIVTGFAEWELNSFGANCFYSYLNYE